jgi:hypothetical protein
MESKIVSKTDIGGGYTIEQLQDYTGAIYYRVCHRGVCRYCEDEYYAHMYAAQMGWNQQ